MILSFGMFDTKEIIRIHYLRVVEYIAKCIKLEGVASVLKPMMKKWEKGMTTQMASLKQRLKVSIVEALFSLLANNNNET